ncbi:hypothetical protein Trydic_g10842 [Trypoxylus dichotomus]
MFTLLREQINSWVAIAKDGAEAVVQTTFSSEKRHQDEDDVDENCGNVFDPDSNEVSNVQQTEDHYTVAPQEGTRESANEEGDIFFENLQTKAFTNAKLFGNYLYSTATEIGTKIKKTIADNSYLQEFNKEQLAFSKELANKHTLSPLAPWVGCANEDRLKEVCLSLSSDRRNFFRNPPEGVDFEFDYDSLYPVAEAIMELDANLVKMRYELVPKLICEENFWRNYFYRVSLVCQANGAPFIPKYPAQVNKESSSEVEDVSQMNEDVRRLSKSSTDGNRDTWEEELEAELEDYEDVGDEKVQI